LNLTLDIGNSLQKIAVFNKDEYAYSESFDCITEEILESVLQQFPITNSIVSTVAGVDAKLIDFLKKNTEYLHFSHETKLPITLLYESVETLGLDRIACAVGAAMLYPKKNVLSIQMGTCMVLDFVNNKMEYLGGSISPGLQMRYEVLQKKTKKLPLLKATEKHPNIWGNDTNSSINSGVISGLCFEIDGFINAYKERYLDLIVLLTGGDAICLQYSIKNTIFAVPNLVLKGLNEIIKYNV
jgi:type III pantothenate kinase